MNDLNDCKFRGRLVKEPVRVTKNGSSRIYFTLAVDRNIRKNAQDKKNVDFIPFVAFSNVANFIEKYAKKGRLVAIDDSSFRIGSWQDGDGNWQTRFNFVVGKFAFLDKMQSDPEPAIAKTVEADEEFENASHDVFTSNQGFMPVNSDEDVPF